MRLLVATALLTLAGCLPNPPPPEVAVRPSPPEVAVQPPPPEVLVQPPPDSEEQGPPDYSKGGSRGQFGSLSEGWSEHYVRQPNGVLRVAATIDSLAVQNRDWCKGNFLVAGTATDPLPCPRQNGFGPLLKQIYVLLISATRNKCPARCPTATYQEVYSEWSCAGPANNQPTAFVFLKLLCVSDTHGK